MSEKNKVIKKQINYIEFLKNLTKWFTNHKRTDEQLDEIINKYDVENSIVKRILSYNYSFPYIIYYFNKYFNNSFDFNRFDTKILLKSISYLMDINNRNSGKNFIYLKSNELKDEVKDIIKRLIKQYFSKIYKIELQGRDLDIYYRLFKLGVIKDEDLLEIDRLLNQDKPTIKSLDIVNFKSLIWNEESEKTPENEEETVQLSEKIIEFINQIKGEKLVREECQKCSLFNKPIVVLDTNVKELGEVDIVFIGLNPGVDEVKQDKPFVGDSGKYIRKIINQLPKDKKWLIFNTILCHTSNKDEIEKSGGTRNVMKNCFGIVSKIFETFPSTFFVPIGDDAKELFQISGKITNVSGKVFEGENNIKTIPLIHPSSVLRNSKFQSIFDQSVKNILNQFGVNEEVETKKIDSGIMVSDIKDLLLVDAKRIEGNKILMIFTDHSGNKKYHIKDFNFPILIKNKDWNQCNMTTDKVDSNLIVNDYQRTQILKKCHQILNSMVDL